MISTHKFKIVTHPVGKEIFRIAEIEDPEILLEDFFKKKSNDPAMRDEQIPYWGELWPSALALSQYISENPILVNGKNAIEIGCGLGLPGIVAAKSGANVILTDYLPAALEFAAYNWTLNIKTAADVRLLDWRRPGNIQPADVLLASDIAYESRSFKPLLNGLKLLLKKDGVILMSEPNRKFAKIFFTSIKEEGFSVKDEIRNIVKTGIKYKISIYKISRSNLSH